MDVDIPTSIIIVLLLILIALFSFLNAKFNEVKVKTSAIRNEIDKILFEKNTNELMKEAEKFEMEKQKK